MKLSKLSILHLLIHKSNLAVIFHAIKIPLQFVFFRSFNPSGTIIQYQNVIFRLHCLPIITPTKYEINPFKTITL